MSGLVFDLLNDTFASCFTYASRIAKKFIPLLSQPEHVCRSFDCSLPVLIKRRWIFVFVFATITAAQNRIGYDTIIDIPIS